MKSKFPLRLWLIWMLHASMAEAETQSLAEIQQTIRTYLVSILQREYRDFDVAVAPLDPRLKLPRCSKALSVSQMRKTVLLGDVSLKVRCEGEHSWTIYAKAHVSLFRKVVVLAHPLPKGARLTPDVVTLKRFDVSALRQGYIERPETVIGRLLKRRVAEGYVLTPNLLMADKVIHKGDAVMIRALAGALDVRMGGHALMDGEMGQKIRVLNDRTRRVIEAVVHGPSEVRVLF